MAKGKKLLSVILALVMVFSAMSAALVAFATTPEDVVERINAFSGTTGSKATEEEIKEFESIAADYKALTDKQKDELDLVATGKIFKLAYQRGEVVHADVENGMQRPAYADQFADEILGRSANAKKARSYWENFCKTKVTVGGEEIAIKDVKAANIQADTEGVIAAAFDKAASEYKELGAAARYLPLLYYGSSYIAISGEKGISYYYWAYDDSTKAVKEFWDYYKAFKEAEMPFTEKAPDYKDTEKYPNGSKDEQYKADKAAYEIRKAQAEAVWCVYAWEQVLKLDEALVKPTYDVGVEMANLLKKYVADNSSVSGKEFSDVYAKYEALSSTEKLFFDKSTSMKYDYIDTYGLVAFPAITSAIKGLVGAPRVEAFVAVVNEAKEPYTREAIQKAIDAWSQIFKESYSQIPKDVIEKFKSMIAAMPASEEKPVLPDWTRPDLKYSAEVDEKRLALLIENLDSMINGLIKQQGYDSINDILASELYTNYTIASIPQALYPMLEQLLNDNGAGIAVNFLKITPKKLASVMDEEKFVKARDLFNSLAPEGEADKTANWANLDLTKVENGTFGFKDGDREGFVNALAAVLRGVTVPLSSGMLALDFTNTVVVSGGYPTGEYVYGLYEYLIPVFEALDIEGFMTSREYTEQFEAAQGNAKGDAAILPIINPVFDFVEKKLAAAPLSTLVDLLPKLAHVLNDNILNDQLQLIHGTLGMVGNYVSPDLLHIDPSAIIGLVNGLVGNLKIGDVTLSLKLSDPDWTLLASTAKPVIKNSVSGDNAFRVGFETNKSDAFLVTFRYLFENITEKNNLDSIKNAISALVTDPTITQVVDQFLGSVSGLSADQALAVICDLLGVPQTEGSTDPETPTDPGADGSNPTPPANGDTLVASALAAVAVLAGAALVITRKRK